MPKRAIRILCIAMSVMLPLAAEAAAKIDAERATRAAIPPTRIVGEAFFAEIVSALAGCIAVDRERAVRRGDVHAVRVLENKKDFTLNSLIAAAYDSGDHLHPNDVGYKAMAEAIVVVTVNARRCGNTSLPRHDRAAA